MARLVTCGFEGGEATLDGYTVNAAGWSYTTTAPRAGLQAMTTTSSLSKIDFSLGTVALGTTIFGRLAYQFTTVPTGAATTLIEIRDAANTTVLASIVIDVDGSLKFNTIQSSPLSLNAYHVIEFSVQIVTGASDVIGLRVDGSLVSSITTSISDTAPGNVRIRGPSGTGTSTIDDVAINDDTGAAQTSWPGAGNIVMLTPVSDNSVGTGWTLSTGTAISSNGWDSVNNEPPQGVADLTALSDAKQIRNATSNANVDYKGNTGTYLAAGLGASDTVTLCQAVIATAAPSATSPKSGNLGATNPTITLATIGTFENASTLAGTYPSGWKVTRSAIQYAPSVTLGSAAVLDVQQVTSSTRIAMVCFLGMVVEYVPAPAVIPPGLGPVVSMQQMFISDMSLMR